MMRDLKRAVAMAGCGALVIGAATSVPARESQDGAVAICILADQTRSTEGTGIPQLQPAQLAPLVDLIKERGGEIALGIVREASNLPLTRLYLPPPPAAAAKN